MKLIGFLIPLIALSCQHNKPIQKPVSSNNKTTAKLRKLSPKQKYLKCLKENPKSIVCNWEMGWIYYTQGRWKLVQKHWNISRYISKSPKFKKHVSQKLLLINDLAALEDLSKKYNKQTVTKNKRAPAQLKKSAFHFSAVGDVMLGLEKEGPLPYQGKNPFSELYKNFPKNSVNFVNLEGTFCDSIEAKSKCGEDSKNCYSFKTPKKYFKFIKETFNLASLANNHTMDFGKKCLNETRKLLSDAKIPYSDGIKEVAQFKHNGLEIGFVAFHTGNHFNFNVNNIKKAKQLIKNLKQKSNIVIVSFHAGAEGLGAVRIPYEQETYFREKRGEVRKFAKELVDNGADILIGHGPHVVRGVELYKNKVIAYSLGNFLTYGPFNLNGLLRNGLILQVETDREGNFLAGNIISTVQDTKGKVLVDKRKTSLNYIRALSKIDFPKSKLEFSKTGDLNKTSRTPASVGQFTK